VVSKKWKQVRYAMLALTSYEQSNGFSALNADELYFINGGSVTATTVIGVITAGAAVVGLIAGGIASAASTPVTGPVGPAATVAAWSNAVAAAGGFALAVDALRN
jgi:hypothetical protein